MISRRSFAIPSSLVLSLGLLNPTTEAGQGPESKLTGSQMSRLVQLQHELAVGLPHRSADFGQRYRYALMLLDLAWLTLLNGEPTTAKQHADEALELSTSLDPPADGHLFHGSHLVLGHVALAGGDVELAKAHLIAAG